MAIIFFIMNKISVVSPRTSTITVHGIGHDLYYLTSSQISCVAAQSSPVRRGHQFDHISKDEHGYLSLVDEMSLAKPRSLYSDNWMQLGGDMTGDFAGGHFGASVATSKDGSFVVVGSRKVTYARPTDGLVKAYKHDMESEGWMQMGQDIVGEKRQDWFGDSVDMNDDGNVIIVGACYGSRNNLSNNGRARVFKYNDEEDRWDQVGQALDGQESGEWFGRDVAILGNGKRVAAGGPGYAQNGIIRVYEYNEGIKQWQQLGGKVILREQIGDALGSSLDMNSEGNALVAGYPGNDDKI